MSILSSLLHTGVCKFIYIKGSFSHPHNRSHSTHLLVVVFVLFLFLDLVFVAVGKSVGFGIVEQGLAAVSPRKRFSADAEMLVWNKLIPRVGHMFHLSKIGVETREGDSGTADEDGYVLPHLRTSMTSSGTRTSGQTRGGSGKLTPDGGIKEGGHPDRNLS